MKLEQFISESLVAINSALRAAHDKSGVPLQEGNFRVEHPIPPGFVITPDGSSLMPVIEFDLAVTVDKDIEVSAGVGAALSIVGIGAKGKTYDSEVSVNRIRFSIPLRPSLPDPDSEKSEERPRRRL